MLMPETDKPEPQDSAEVRWWKRTTALVIAGIVAAVAIIATLGFLGY